METLVPAEQAVITDAWPNYGEQGFEERSLSLSYIEGTKKDPKTITTVGPSKTPHLDQ